MRRRLQVVKMRSADIDTDTQDLRFTDAGLVVGEAGSRTVTN